LQIAHESGHESRLADSWAVLSEVFRVTGRFAESEATVREGIREVSATQAEPWRLMELYRRLGDLLTARNDLTGALAAYEKAESGWWTQTAAERPPEKERMIFGSFIAFWEKAAEKNSPVANPRRLAEWRQRLQEWTDARSGGLPRQP
jgi:hypothetical protein